jgi:single-stranded-DNA-specific exonuclease
MHEMIRRYFKSLKINDHEYIESFLRRAINYDNNPFIMKDVERAIDRLYVAIVNYEPIVIFGDYDADGITSTALATSVLTHMGANVVRSHIPSRGEGYGITVEGVKGIVKQLGFSPSVVLTVDNGIKGLEVSKYCRDSGIDLIVTDHHLVEDNDFPTFAYAIVNTQQTACKYPNVNLSGCGTVYKVLKAMHAKYFPTVHACDPDNYLDFVAIGTVADVMSLLNLENRQIVWRGLEQMRTNPRPGLRSLFKSLSMDNDNLTSEDIGFFVGPAINAASRVDDPSWAYNLLMSKTEAEADYYADKVVELNAIRKNLQAKAVADANDILSWQSTAFQAMPVVVVLLDCPPGIVGLVAAELARQYHRPAMVVREDETGGHYHGSARSVPGFNITHAFGKANQFVNKFGGHSMAAGFSTDKNQFNSLVQHLSDQVFSYFGPHYVPETQLQTVDYTCSLHDIYDMYNIQQALEPFGSGVPRPVYASRDLIVYGAKYMGGGQHAKFNVADAYGNSASVVAWRNNTLVDQIAALDTVDIAYTLHKGKFMGKEELRLQFLYLLPKENITPATTATTAELADSENAEDSSLTAVVQAKEEATARNRYSFDVSDIRRVLGAGNNRRIQ